MPEPIKTTVRPPKNLNGGKRTNLERSQWTTDWWVGWGKDEGCQFEGSWAAMTYLAAKILSHPATEVTSPNLYRPDLAEAMTDEQARNYTSEPVVDWPSREEVGHDAG